MSKYPPVSGYKRIDLNKYTSNIAKGQVFEVDLEYSKILRELHNVYPLAPDKKEMKREMLSEYQVEIADLYNISLGYVKILVPYFFHKENYSL